ncbi:HEAT repeat domain-containing protein [Marimonas arenosa]|uniref:HEAT repeat domain-containing protein n=1 Tax=Marimonas arenosa TaxID=1795305 RepID=A0AAE3WC96_9RHOB|nr:HEAT repeat domain-containing protein [Marimonas arenosa]MDQ2090069.1 HEAT repeat domain-containing protein [Marimonas arenosa]
MNRFFLSLLAAALALAATTAGRADSQTDDAALLELLRNAPDEEQRIDVLDRLANRTSETVRVALETLATDDAQPGTTRMHAICALQGAANHDSVPVLLTILEQDLSQRRGFWACAIPLLGSLGDRRSVPLLMQIADLNEEHLAGMDHMAIEALAAFGDDRDVRFLESKSHIWSVRPAVFQALSRIADPSSAETLVTGLYPEDDPEVLAAAQSGLRRIGAPARPALEAALQFPADEVFKQRVEELLKDIP